MNISAQHQQHMNITDARKMAVKKMTESTGMKFYIGSEKHTKARVIAGVKKGIFDGWFFGINNIDRTITVSYSNRYGMMRKIGN